MDKPQFLNFGRSGFMLLLLVGFLGCGEALKDDEGTIKPQDTVVSSKDDIEVSTEYSAFSDSLSVAIDEHRRGVDAWVNVTRVERDEGRLKLRHVSYGDTSVRNDFWPASTIKMFTATAALELLTSWGFSIDAVATFHYQNEDGEWVEDVSMSFRELVRRTFDCSSNITYTLLLRLAGVDWLNETFFPKYGMTSTALMRGYVRSTDRPYGYQIWVPQKIVITDAGRQIERIHTYGGRDHATLAGCTVWNTYGSGNCSSPIDMSEHLRRIMMHEQLPQSDRFEIRSDLISWYRGETDNLVLNNIGGDDCGGPVLAGIRKVFEAPELHHKEGLVSEYRGSIHYVKDESSQTEYVAAVMLKSPDAGLLEKISEEIGRVMKDGANYVHLGSLRDYVNPIQTNITVNADQPGTVKVLLKPYDQNAYTAEGWFESSELTQQVGSGLNSISLQSGCENEGTYHVRAILENTWGETITESDLHYVIVENGEGCN